MFGFSTSHSKVSKNNFDIYIYIIIAFVVFLNALEHHVEGHNKRNFGLEYMSVLYETHFAISMVMQ